MNWTTFVALIAVFQNNDETRQMLENINGLDCEIKKAMIVQDYSERS